MVGKSARLAVIPQQSTQNTANLPLQTYEKNQSTFFLLFNTGSDFSLHNNFANSGFCAKVSVPVHIYNSLICYSAIQELPTSCYLLQHYTGVVYFILFGNCFSFILLFLSYIWLFFGYIWHFQLYLAISRLYLGYIW